MTMEDQLKCFVCQSKSKPADEKRRRINSNYNNLDPSTWKIFCHYFYPPPLASLLDFDFDSSPENEHQNEDFSLPVFCDPCYQTILNLCNLQSQLELIQNLISSIVAQVSLDFVQEDRQVQKRKKEQEENQQCDENVIYSMRRVIRQRYQPFVCTSRANLGIVNKDSGGGGRRRCKNNDLKAGEKSSLCSTQQADLNLDLESDVDFSLSIKQEYDDSIDPNYADYEPYSDNDDDDNLDEKEGQQQQQHLENLLKPSKDLKVGQNIHEYNGQWRYEKKLDETLKVVYYCLTCSKTFPHRRPLIKHIESQHNKGYASSPEPKQQRQINLLKKPTIDPKVGDNIYEYKGRWRYEKKLDEHGNVGYYCLTCPKVKSERSPLVRHIEGQHIKAKQRKKRPLRPTVDPKVGENIYEYKGQWRYEKKLDEHGNVGYYCLSCPKSLALRRSLISHIESRHCNKESRRKPHCGFRTQRLDDNKFIYHGIYSIQKVTEPIGVFFKCDTCQNMQKTMDLLKKHIKETHIDPKRLVCEKCGKGCPNKNRLDEHMESHDEVGKYICDMCGKNFKHKGSLSFHKESHLGQRYICECGTKFVHVSDMRKHMRRKGHQNSNLTDKVSSPTPDTNESPFVTQRCTFCNRWFSKQETIDKHSSTCFMKKKKPCDKCGGLYTMLKKHLSKCKGINKKGQINFQNVNEMQDEDADVDEHEKEAEENY